MAARWPGWLVFNVLLGVAVAVGIAQVAPQYLQRAQESTKGSLGGGPLKPAYDFLAFVCQFFVDAHGHPLGLPVFYLLVAVAVPAELLMAVEANRFGAGGLLAWYSFFLAVLQVLGIGATVPLLWIPAYLINWRKGGGNGGMRLSAYKTWFIGVALWAQHIPALGSYLFTSPSARAVAAIVTVFAPFAGPVVWTWIRSQPKRQSNSGGGNGSVSTAADGASAAVAHYNLAAGIGVALWMLVIIQVIDQWSVVAAALKQMLQNPEASAGAAANAMLAIDAAGLWLSLVGFAAAEDGLTAAAKVAAGSLLVGPGAAVALYLGNVRERRIGLAVTQSLRKSE